MASKLAFDIQTALANMHLCQYPMHSPTEARRATVTTSNTVYNEAGFIVLQDRTLHCTNNDGVKYTREQHYEADFGNVTPRNPPNRALTLDYGNDD